MIAAYVRVSTDDQTTALQREAIGRYLDLHTTPIPGLPRMNPWYEDQASGAERSRPALDALMAEVRRGTITQVVVWKFDRFARSTRHLLDALEEFRSRGVAFTSLTEGIDTTTAMGRLVYTFLAAIAEFERDLIRDRVRAGIRAYRQARPEAPWGRRKRWADIPVIEALRAEGKPWRVIAAETGLSPRTIRRRLGNYPPEARL